MTLSDYGDAIKRAKNGDEESILDLLQDYDWLLNKYARLYSKEVDEDCKQELTIVFLQAIERFDMDRYME